ncbi:MAG: hypothetical protein J0M05_08640 [Candidatus Kapabacteria bacterium]|jgi:hypothetical protein|nr:hypothetical protein [Candidatus Kapabacteria bacterium]
MKRTKLQIFIPLVIILLSSILFQTNAQSIKIDIKTELSDKASNDVQAIKAGIISTLKDHITWIKVVNVGEDYSFWIKNLSLTPKKDNPFITIVSFNLELRTAAMFSQGKLIIQQPIKFEYDPQQELPLQQKELETYLSKINKDISGAGITTIAAISTLGTSILAQACIKTAAFLQKDFTAAQQKSAILAGYYTVHALYSMLKKQGHFN